MSTTTQIDRLALLDRLAPYCEPAVAALLYPKAGGKLSPGWVRGEAEVERALAAWKNGTLSQEVFDSKTKDGTRYRIERPARLGLVPHRDGMVSAFVVDLDDHAGDGGNVHQLDSLRRLLGADPIVFTSKSGVGLHLFFVLATPMPVGAFVAWAKALGFNRSGAPEVFPKTTGLTQAWLPNAPNDKAGDVYRGGDFDSAIVGQLPTAPPVRLSTRTLDFLRGGTRPGNRNIELNAAAHELARKGVDRDAAWRLCENAASVCGLLADEPDQCATTFGSGFDTGWQKTSHSVRSSSGGTAPSLWMSESRTDAANARRFAARYGDVVRWVEVWKSWVVFDGARWRIDNLAAEALFKKIAADLWTEALEIVQRGENQKTKTEAVNFAKMSNSEPGIRHALALARSESGIAVTPDVFDADGWLLNVKNGTVDLRTGALRAHDKADMLTKLCPTPFDPDAGCPRWLSVLDRITGGDADLAAYLQRCVGMTLAGTVRDHVLLLLYGTGANGKSTFLNAMMGALGTDYAMVAPPGLLSVKKHEAHPTERADLFGKRMVCCIEAEAGLRLAESLVKSLTGGDPIRARWCGKDFFEFPQTHTVWKAVNAKPQITGTDKGIWRRVKLLPFTVTIPDDEQDRDLPAALHDESAGLLSWAVRGGLAWQQGGLDEPEAVTTATAAYKAEEDIVGRFVKDCCTANPTGETFTSVLLAAFERWCERNGEHCPGGRVLGARLTEMGFGTRRSTGGRTVRTGLTPICQDFVVEEEKQLKEHIASLEGVAE